MADTRPGRYPSRTDGDLVAAAQGGDREALEALLERHHDRLHALCRRLTGNDADAADATQEALIAVVRGLARFDNRSSFTTWAYRVATNAALDELRRRRRRPEPGLPDGPGARPAGGAWGVASPGGEGTVEQALERMDIDAALARLPADFRAPVVLRDLCALTYEEIADVLDLPPGTVRSRISRGRAALAELIAPEGNREPPARRPNTRPSTERHP